VLLAVAPPFGAQAAAAAGEPVGVHPLLEPAAPALRVGRQAALQVVVAAAAAAVFLLLGQDPLAVAVVVAAFGGAFGLRAHELLDT
jgi:hypothetical protein